jgi:hypothetical protein
MDKKVIDKDLMASILLLLVGLFFAVESLRIDYRGPFQLGPGMFPFLCAVILVLLSLVYLIRSLKRGGRVSGFRQIFKDIVLLQENRRILLAIAMVAFFIFVGVAYISYYATAAVFLFLMGYKFVSRYKIWHSIIFSSVVPLVIYLIFNKIFSIRLM